MPSAAFLVELLSPDEVNRFKAFAEYKRKLNKVVEQPGFPRVIDWPEAPLWFLPSSLVFSSLHGKLAFLPA